MNQYRRAETVERPGTVPESLGWPVLAVGVVLGKAAPGMMERPRGLEFGAGSQINIAVPIWLMI